MGLLRRPLILLGACALALAACGDDAPDVEATGPPFSAPAIEDRGEGFDERTAPARRVESRDDLDGEFPLTPILVEVHPDDPQRLLVRLWGGVEPCFGVRVAIEETDTLVTVELFGGTPPEGRGMACILIAELQVVEVELDRALGDRDLVSDVG